LVKRDISVEKSSTEIKTVAEIHARSSGIQRRMKTGMIKTPTASKTLSNLATAETLASE
jgi:hypothetical protein